MKICIFTPSQITVNRVTISDTVKRIAAETHTDALVLAIYLLPGQFQVRGTAYVRNWHTPEKFISKRGVWKCSARYPVPDDLPEKFKLIRLRLDVNTRHYPREEMDIYGWTFEYKTFQDHLARLFAHELHHFRRYHLNLHPGEGEQKANQWSLKHIQQLGYQVSGVKKKNIANTKKKKRFHWLKHDPYKQFRNLKAGSRIKIKNDPKNHYTNKTAIVLRPVRSNSKRIVIETPDGKQWRWPMQWVEMISS